MHFRRRGNNVQIVKTQPGEGGKASSRPIGSANITTGVITAKAAEVLTPEETQEVQAWIARHKSIEAQKREVEYRCLGETLSSLAAWVRTADAGVVAEHGEEVRSGLSQMRRAIAVALGEERVAAGEQGKAKGARKGKA